MSIQTDTIAAVATPAGSGAIGILRLSGPRAADIAAAVFRPLGKKGLLDRPVRTLVYGDLLDREGQVIDRVLCTYSRGPESYTGEDTAELHCHGSPMVLTLGLEALFAQGARQAGPGEFTQRAFLNGRLDLAQAEAVADLLDAQSREGARHAAGQLSGALSRRVGEIYSALVDLMAHFHAVLDYPDEDIDPFTQEQLSRDLTRQETALERLLATYRRGRQLSRGCGAPSWGGPTRASPPCSTPWWGMSGPSSPTSQAPPGTRWRKMWSWGASPCGSSTPPGCGTAPTPSSSWGWSAAGPPWRRPSSSFWWWTRRRR